jgi:predicted ATPase
MEKHIPRLIVVTGGPGAGKTAVLEMARRSFCRHVVVLPEAASIIYHGGFWRRESEAGKRAAQRAIFHVQREQERMLIEEGCTAILCDRGTVDGLAYWPGPQERFLKELQITREGEVTRYRAVIHMHTPPADEGYNHQNPLRTESPEEALALDAAIARAWEGHPRRHFVAGTQNFLEKAHHTLDLIRAELPLCCEEPPQGRQRS